MIEFDNRQCKMQFNENMEVLIEKSIQAALDFEGFSKPYEISVVITDNEGIRELNGNYRGIDKDTDVLSFPMLEFDEGYSDDGEIEIGIEDINPEGGEVVLGDIVISIEKTYSQAQEYGHSFDRELAFLTVHSTLHLLGYDHETEEDRIIMRGKEEEILNILNLHRV